MRLVPVVSVLLGAGLVAVLYPLFAPASDRHPHTTLCLSNLKMLGVAELIYASDFDDRFSPREGWMDRAYPYIKDWNRYHCPQAKGKWGYAYDGALAGEKMPSGSSSLPMIYDSLGEGKNAFDLVTSLPSPGRHDGMDDIVYADGHVRRVAAP